MIRVVLHSENIRALLLSKPMQLEIQRRASRIAAAAGDGVKAVPLLRRRNRVGTRVVTVTDEARQRQARDNILAKAIDAGR